MPIQFTDFSKAPLQDSSAADLFENLLKGYKIGREPANMARAEQKNQQANDIQKLELEHKPTEYALSDQQKRLANSLQDLALKHKPKEYSLSDSLKEAQIDKAKNPKSTAFKPNSTVANQEYIWNLEHPNGVATPEEEAEHIALLKKAYQSGQDRTQALTERTQDITSGASFDRQPVNEKKRAVALTTGMGIDPIEAVKLLRKGQTLEEIAKSHGLKLGDVTPIYPIGEENVKQLQRRRGFISELKNLEGKTAEPLSRYPSKILNYSLAQIADSLDIKDPQEMGKVLAARALSPEIAALRLKVAGGNIGIEAINELQNKSLTNLGVVEGLVDTPTYLAMQKYMTQWLEEAAESFNNTVEDYSKLKSPKSGRTYDLDAKRWQ